MHAENSHCAESCIVHLAMQAVDMVGTNSISGYHFVLYFKSIFLSTLFISLFLVKPSNRSLVVVSGGGHVCLDVGTSFNRIDQSLEVGSLGEVNTTNLTLIVIDLVDDEISIGDLGAEGERPSS